MFCAKCGKEMDKDARFCPSCRFAISDSARIQSQTSAKVQPQSVNAKSRISYILLGIFLGCLGIHNFYAGYTGRAVAQLLITLFAGWLIISWFAVWIWCIIEVCAVRVDAHGIKFDV